MAIFFHLNAMQAIILLIKSQFGSFLVRQSHRNDIDWITKTGVNEEFLPLFTEGCKELNELKSTWPLMNLHFGIDENLGLNEELYSQLIHHMMLSRVFYFGIQSNETQTFIGDQLHLIELLKTENSEFNDLYHARNKQWLFLVQTAENMHIKAEAQRLENAEIERKWLITFGDDWYELTRADLALQSAKRQLEMKQNNPSMTIQELEEADRLMVEAEQNQLRNLGMEITISQIYAEQAQWSSGGHQVDQKLLEQYKKVLRLIWIKTHPDKVANKGFTAEQLEILTKFYQQATEMSAAERVVNPLNLQRLEQLLNEVDELYANMGLNLTLNTTVKGNTLKEKVEWLELQIKRIEQELTQLKNELFSLANDTTIKQKEGALSTPQAIDDIKKQMVEKKKLLEFELGELKRKLNDLFKQ
jgi:archaellum component FlaC